EIGKDISREGIILQTAVKDTMTYDLALIHRYDFNSQSNSYCATI
ncbi:16940_t:CDS:1, partial [Gigaspora rosea]